MAQKYTVVHFFEPIAQGYNFPATAWPLHSTLLDLFTLGVPAEEYVNKIAKVARGTRPFKVEAVEDTFFGPDKNIAVTLLSKTAEMATLHDKLVTAAIDCKAIFDNPQYTCRGFVPHATVQQNAQLVLGQSYPIGSISIIDMFPSRDILRREVLVTLPLIAD